MELKTDIWITLAKEPNKPMHYTEIVQKVQQEQINQGKKPTRASNIERTTRHLAQYGLIKRQKKGTYYKEA